MTSSLKGGGGTHQMAQDGLKMALTWPMIVLAGPGRCQQRAKKCQQGVNWVPAGASGVRATRGQPPVSSCKQTATSSFWFFCAAGGRAASRSGRACFSMHPLAVLNTFSQ